MAPWNWCNVSWLGQLINLCCNCTKVGFKKYFFYCFSFICIIQSRYILLYMQMNM